MGKLKVGDEVRRVKSSNELKEGEIYVVSKLKDYGMIHLKGFNKELYDVDNFELVEEPQFKRGDEVFVRDSKCCEFKKRIYLETIKGSEYPYITVRRSDNEKFLNGKKFNTSYFREMKSIPQPEEMTLEQVCKELGREIRIIKK